MLLHIMQQRNAIFFISLHRPHVFSQILFLCPHLVEDKKKKTNCRRLFSSSMENCTVPCGNCLEGLSDEEPICNSKLLIGIYILMMWYFLAVYDSPVLFIFVGKVLCQSHGCSPVLLERYPQHKCT
jgi:hypothetical protein